MVYGDGAVDSKAVIAIHHFETALDHSLFQGIAKKRDTHSLNLDVTLEGAMIHIDLWSFCR